MTSCSVAEATARLPDLIDRALNGEPVVITREGEPVVELKPLTEAAHPGSRLGPRRVTAADLEWLAAHRLKLAPGAEDAAAVVSRMRDEDDL